MLESLSLKKISTIVVVVLLFTASAFVTAAYFMSTQVVEIDKAWISFKSQHAEKARLETSLRASLGYGGMIHDFKNYILRKDFEGLVKLQKSLGATQSTVKQYVALSATQAEKIVLEDIQEMLSQYQQGLQLARKQMAKGKSSKEIDDLVRIDDSYALRGLEVLNKEIALKYSYYNDKNQKPVLANLIRAKLGYGGMIHSFKNYVLRGDEKYYLKSKESIVSTLELIKRYKKLPHSLGEKTALDDIVFTLYQYKSRLNRAKKMIAKDMQPEVVDRAVRVNDKHALRGLTTLDHDIINEIENKSNEMSVKLSQIIKNNKIVTYAILFMILFLAFSLYLLFSRRIIGPVVELSNVMSRIAHGEIDARFKYSDSANTELGEMARSLNILKENECKRKEAEEEIRRMAMTDPLTGLANRNQLDRRYHDLVLLAKREQRLIAIFTLDLDDFKPVNDQHGHDAGDIVLKSVARKLLLLFRETDLVVRLGGDEFLVVLYGPENVETIKSVAQRVIDLLSRPVLVGKDILSIGVSIGIALHKPNNSEPMNLLIKRADTALYKAKSAGRSTYHIDESETVAETITLIPNSSKE